MFASSAMGAVFGVEAAPPLASGVVGPTEGIVSISLVAPTISFPAAEETLTTPVYEHRLVDGDGERRIRTVAVATLASGIAITGFFAVITYLVAPEHGWVSAFALGGVSGIWVAILGGAVVGNGIHEYRAERSDR